MTIKKVEDLVREHPFFRGMRSEHVATISTCAANVRFKPGDAIFSMDEPSNHFYLIEEGRAAVGIGDSDQELVTVQTVEAGGVLGWTWIFPPYRHHFNARCVEPIKGYVFDAACIRKKCEADNVLGYALMKHFSALMIERLRATRLQLLDLAAQ